MKVDNAPVVLRDRQLMYIMAISLVLLLSIILFADIFDNPVFGISREIYAGGIATVYVFINIFRFILDLNYFSYTEQGEKIVIHYFSLRPFMQKRMSIEIPKANLIKYQLTKSFFGQKKQLVLYQRVNNKTAKYPPISISALNKTELNDLITSLNVISKTK